MFTGIVEEAGVVESLILPEGKEEKNCQLAVLASVVHQGVQLGDSIANNGCCLTVTHIEGKQLIFDLLQETLRCTNLGNLKKGDRVNLERSLRFDDRMGGHFVTGHVETTGTITKWGKKGADYELEIEMPTEFEKYVVPKGCIAVDGISLTVGQVEGRKFNIWIIPHTYEVTALKEREVGSRVNLEFDLLAKYVEKLGRK